MTVLIREGSAAKNLEAIVKGIVENNIPVEGFCFCTDDKHIEDIYEEYRLENLCVEGIFSHFPVSDCLDEDCTEFTKKQIQLFDEVIDLLKSQGIDPGIRHLQNSYGILNYPELEYE